MNDILMTESGPAPPPPPRFMRVAELAEQLARMVEHGRGDALIFVSSTLAAQFVADATNDGQPSAPTASSSMMPRP